MRKKGEIFGEGVCNKKLYSKIIGVVWVVFAVSKRYNW